MGVSNLRYAVLCCATRSHSLKLRRVRITEQFRLLGVEFNVILNMPVGIKFIIAVVPPFFQKCLVTPDLQQGLRWPNRSKITVFSRNETVNVGQLINIPTKMRTGHLQKEVYSITALTILLGIPLPCISCSQYDLPSHDTDTQHTVPHITLCKYDTSFVVQVNCLTFVEIQMKNKLSDCSTGRP